MDKLIALCHRYGTPKFVSGGGGNVSWKKEHTLWIKASGTCLSEADASTLVRVKREPLGDLYRTPAPLNVSERESWAQQIIQKAAQDSPSTGRPSVETPLHDLFEAAYVVHTHPPLVNGLTCSKNAEPACRELFPEALWVPYIDPGVTLCLYIQRQFEAYVHEHGREPSIIMMQNHGLVVAADDLNEIDEIHERIFRVLEDTYRDAGLDVNSPDFKTKETDPSLLPDLVNGSDQQFTVLKCSEIQPALGPLTPDHIVYSGVEPLNLVNGHSQATYREQFGTDPQILIHEGVMYGIGTTHSQANNACELAADGAHVLHLTRAFGGSNFMSKEQWQFVVNWEAEAYRQSVAQ